MVVYKILLLFFLKKNSHKAFLFDVYYSQLMHLLGWLCSDTLGVFRSYYDHVGKF